MNFENHSTIVKELIAAFGEEVIKKNAENEIQPYVEIEVEKLLEVTHFLKHQETCFFDFLNCISAVDNGTLENTVELWYHLSSIPLEQSFIIKVTLPRNSDGEKAPSLTSIWKTADWHEREAFDLVGIQFINHPDLRRILLPSDWQGHPLRKDYEEQEKYHGINVKYDR